MIKNIRAGFICIALLFAGAASADYSFQLGDSKACEHIEGEWSGKGKASNWLLGSCTYHGTGTISPVDSSGHFTALVNVSKDHGKSICPAHATEQLNAVCVDGVITIKTEFGHLKGNLDANSGSAKGTLTVSPGVDAEVTMRFYR